MMFCNTLHNFSSSSKKTLPNLLGMFKSALDIQIWLISGTQSINTNGSGKCWPFVWACTVCVCLIEVRAFNTINYPRRLKSMKTSLFKIVRHILRVLSCLFVFLPSQVFFKVDVSFKALPLLLPRESTAAVEEMTDWRHRHWRSAAHPKKRR